MAHAIFKVGLFLGVGVIDHEIGTRDVSKIGAARRAMPTTTLAMVLSLLSMAGIIPLLGFATKEKALVALLDLERDAVAWWRSLEWSSGRCSRSPTAFVCFEPCYEAMLRPNVRRSRPTRRWMPTSHSSVAVVSHSPDQWWWRPPYHSQRALRPQRS